MKLNLGCEKKKIPGYINVDCQDTGYADLMFDIREIEKYIPRNSVEVIYISHLLEHFEKNDADLLLRKLYDILQSGGILRIAVPDFESIVQQYHITKNLNELHGLLYGRHDIPFEGHYTIWDYKTLKEQLFNIGFLDVYRYNWRKTDHATIDDYSQAYLPHMDKENGRLMSLNVETTKP